MERTTNWVIHCRPFMAVPQNWPYRSHGLLRWDWVHGGGSLCGRVWMCVAVRVMVYLWGLVRDDLARGKLRTDRYKL